MRNTGVTCKLPNNKQKPSKQQKYAHMQHFVASRRQHDIPCHNGDALRICICMHTHIYAHSCTMPRELATLPQ